MTEGEVLYCWRKGRRLSQADVATQFGLHQTAVSKMEQGKLRPSDRVAEVLNGARDARTEDWVFLSVARRRLGLSMQQVAKRLCIATHTLGEIEAGAGKEVERYERWLDRKLKEQQEF